MASPRWKPVEPHRPLKKVDISPHFSDWETCKACGGEGEWWDEEQKTGYAVRTRRKCPECGGHGGRHLNQKPSGGSLAIS